MHQLIALTPSRFNELAELAHTVWYQHYPSIISRDQIAYMLNGRYSDEKLLRYIDSNSQWCWLLCEDTRAVGYVSCALAPDATQMKLEQLYLIAEVKGQGLGRMMMNHVVELARQKHCNQLWLTVNRNNVDAMAVYNKSGFKVREEAQFDIGNGYIMDDYVLELVL
jgi:ribosomal protein S18 acetylase RimI-like enzyme